MTAQLGSPGRILFRESDHVYFHETLTSKGRNREKFTSVTTLLGGLKKGFDAVGESIKYIEKHGYGIFADVAKKKKMKLQDVLDTWGHLPLTAETVRKIWNDISDEAKSRGTTYHHKKEKESYAAGAMPIIEEGDFKVGYDLKFLKNNVKYPELIIYHPFYKVTGTADNIVFLDNKTFSVLDYKGFSLDTPLATKNGWTTIGEIQVGEEVFDGNGKLTKVKNVSEIHQNPCYKIKFDNNEELVCDHEHRWVIKYKMDDNHYKGRNNWVDEQEVTTLEMIELMKKGKVLNIPCVAINLPNIDLPIDPYILGLWIGDGNRTCGTICKPLPEMWKEIKKRGYEVSENHSRNNEKAESRTLFGLQSKLKQLNLLNNKHIPDIYLRSSHEQRLDLLRGILDADGYLNPLRKRTVLETTQLWFAETVSNLISSLGYKPTILPHKTSGFGKKGIQAYSVNFTSIENPFLVRNKNYFEIMENKNFFMSKFRRVKEIKKIETVPTKCIAVESETHCYLAGHGMIKTHNTNIGGIDKPAFKGEKFLTPVSHLEANKLNEYNLQLSIYAFMLEEWGYKCKDLIIQFVEDVEKDKIKEYPVPYLRTEAKAILEYFKARNYKIK